MEILDRLITLSPSRERMSSQRSHESIGLVCEVVVEECNKRRPVAVEEESVGAAEARPSPSTRTTARAVVANKVNFIL